MLPPKSVKFPKIRTYSRLRCQKSSNLVPIENACATCNYSLIVTLDVSRTVIEILAHKARKCLFSSPHPCLTSYQSEPIRISRWNLLHWK